VAVEVAEDEAAAVEEHDERVGARARLGRDVVAGGQRPRGARDLQVVDGGDERGRAGRDEGVAADLLAGACHAEALVRRAPRALDERQQELDLGLERLAVDAHRRPAGQAHLRAGRDERGGAADEQLEPLARGERVHAARRYPARGAGNRRAQKSPAAPTRRVVSRQQESG
jgi:hypothetical protein